VLSPLDFSDSSVQGLRAAIDWSARCAAALHVVHVVDSRALRALSAQMPRVDADELRTIAERKARHAIADALASVATPPGVLSLVLAAPRAADALLQYAADARIDLITMGRHNHAGLDHIFLGSTAQQVVSRAQCPVLTMPPMRA
jgi:nucleotide-binding universal stress UspA family protein